MLEVHRLFKSYDGRPVLRDISFQAGAGETICLLGASGSGKSTLLRIIAGLEEADSGFVSFDGQDLSSTPAHLRDFGLVFQDYALFPHLNVRENVAFGLKRSVRRLARGEIQERVASALELVNLTGYEDRAVNDLSGGEQQRVALARALATRPRLLMFDEPLGALDRILREDLLHQIRTILHRSDIPAIYVTHDQEEAFAIANRMLILHNGEIVRAGTPAEVWSDPGSARVAEFLGLGNVLDAEVTGARPDGAGDETAWEAKSGLGVFAIRCGHGHRTGEKIHLLVRPLPEEGARNIVRGEVADVIFQQERFKTTLDNGLYFYLPDAPRAGEIVDVPVKVECLG